MGLKQQQDGWEIITLLLCLYQALASEQLALIFNQKLDLLAMYSIPQSELLQRMWTTARGRVQVFSNSQMSLYG
jgi:hypothetical protein